MRSTRFLNIMLLSLEFPLQKSANIKASKFELTQTFIFGTTISTVLFRKSILNLSVSLMDQNYGPTTFRKKVA